MLFIYSDNFVTFESYDNTVTLKILSTLLDLYLILNAPRPEAQKYKK